MAQLICYLYVQLQTLTPLLFPLGGGGGGGGGGRTSNYRLRPRSQRPMASSLGRAGARLAGAAARTLLAGSDAAKGGACCTNPLPSVAQLSKAIHFRAAHTIVMVVVKDDTEHGRVYAERLSVAVKQQIALLDQEFARPRSVPVVESCEFKTDEDGMDISESPEKLQRIKTVVAEGMLSEDRENMKTASVALQVDGCLSAIERLRKDIDTSLYAVRWLQETLFEKLEARIVGQGILLKDQGILLKGLHDDIQPNFVESFMVAVGRKLFPEKVITASGTVKVVVPYVTRYAFYGTFIYSLYKTNIPISLKDYLMLLYGSYWLASSELTDRLQSCYDFCKDGGVKKEKEEKK